MAASRIFFGLLCGNPPQHSDAQDMPTPKASPPVLTPQDLEAFARKYAPILLTEGKRYNIPTRADADGDWDASNNASNYDKFLAGAREFIQKPYEKDAPYFPTLYYEAIVTSTHLFITYYLFFPHDAGDYHTFEPGDPRGGHNNDATSLMVVVPRSEKPFRVITQDHGRITSMSQTEIRLHGDRPVLEISSGNHALRGLKNGEKIREEEPEARRQIFLYAHGEKGQEYKLLRVHETLWLQRKNGDLFGGFDGETGVQFKGDHGPWAPWARPFTDSVPGTIGFALGWRLAESFFDPANVLCLSGEECSKGYLKNPYTQDR